MKFSDLKARLPVALGSGLGVVLLILFSHVVYVHIALSAIILAMVGVAIWEYVAMLAKKGVILSNWVLIPLGIVMTLAFYVPPIGPYLARVPVLMIVFSAFVIALSQFHRVEGGVVRIGVSFLGICYVAVPFGMIYRILYPMTQRSLLSNGAFWLVYLVAVTKTTDIFAYFTGHLFGKRKLAPGLSPGKTIEGTLFGVLASGVLSVIFYLFSHLFVAASDNFPLWAWAALGIALGLVGQLGDLSESLIKRDCGVKDSNSLPGVGGMLDLVDSLLFATPLFYFAMGY